MKARELKELRTSNSQDLKVKLNDTSAELFLFIWIAGRFVFNSAG